MTRSLRRDRDLDGPGEERFVDDVMQAIARAAPPSPTRTFLEAVRRRSVGTATSALIVAWHLGTVRTSSIAPGVRARSFALVLAVAFVLGTGTLAAAAAVTTVVPPRRENPAAIDPTPTVLPAAPSSRAASDSAPPPLSSASPVPVVVHPTDRPGRGTVTRPAPHPTAAGVKRDHRQDGSTDAHDGKGSGDADDGSEDARSPQPDDEGDHGGDNGQAAETPEPDRGGSGDDGVNGGTDPDEHRDDANGSGG